MPVLRVQVVNDFRVSFGQRHGNPGPQITPQALEEEFIPRSIVKSLLDHGALVDTRNDDGWTPLHMAASNGSSVELVECLIQYGHADVNRTNNDGNTPLDVARENENEHLIHILTNPPPRLPRTPKQPLFAPTTAPTAAIATDGNSFSKLEEDFRKLQRDYQRLQEEIERLRKQAPVSTVSASSPGLRLKRLSSSPSTESSETRGKGEAAKKLFDEGNKQLREAEQIERTNTLKSFSDEITSLETEAKAARERYILLTAKLSVLTEQVEDTEKERAATRAKLVSIEAKLTDMRLKFQNLAESDWGMNLPSTQPDPKSTFCEVCMERPKNRVLFPCGHTLCAECVLQLHSSTEICPMCAQVFENDISFYL